MTIENDLDRPFGEGKIVEKTWESQNIDDPEDEEIDSDDELDDDMMDDPDNSDELDEEEAEEDQYSDSPRTPSSRGML